MTPSLILLNLGNFNLKDRPVLEDQHVSATFPITTGVSVVQLCDRKQSKAQTTLFENAVMRSSR